MAAGIGTGGVYYIVKEQKARKRAELREAADRKEAAEAHRKAIQEKNRRYKEEYAKAMARKGKKGKDPADGHTKAGNLDQYREALPALLDAANYEKALAQLTALEPKLSSEEDQTAAEELRTEIEEHAENRFRDDRSEVEGLVERGRLDPALAILQKTEAYGFESIASEARELRSDILARKECLALNSQLSAYARLQAQLAGPLNDYDYQAAGAVIDKQAAAPANADFKEDLLAMKGDFKAVETLWGTFLKKMEGSLGSEQMFGIQKGKLTAAKDGAVVIEADGKEIRIPVREMQPKWIELRLDSSGASDPDRLYALGLLYLHKGRLSEASVIFRDLGQAHEGAKRQLRWAAWQTESEAREVLAKAKEASGSGDFIEVKKLVATLREDYSDTKVVALEAAALDSMTERSGKALEEKRGQIEADLAKLNGYAEAARAKLEAWNDELKKKIQDQYEEEMMDPVSYARSLAPSPTGIATRPVTGTGGVTTLPGANTGTGVATTPTQRTRNEPTNKRDNLRALEKMLKNPELSRDAKKRLITLKKKLQGEIGRATSKAKNGVDKLRLRYVAKGDALRNNHIRLQRKVKGGESVSDAEMQAKLKMVE